MVFGLVGHMLAYSYSIHSLILPHTHTLSSSLSMLDDIDADFVGVQNV